jgi:hypothetical protein
VEAVSSSAALELILGVGNLDPVAEQAEGKSIHVGYTAVASGEGAHVALDFDACIPLRHVSAKRMAAA